MNSKYQIQDVVKSATSRSRVTISWPRFITQVILIIWVWLSSRRRTRLWITGTFPDVTFGCRLWMSTIYSLKAKSVKPFLCVKSIITYKVTKSLTEIMNQKSVTDSVNWANNVATVADAHREHKLTSLNTTLTRFHDQISGWEQKETFFSITLFT